MTEAPVSRLDHFDRGFLRINRELIRIRHSEAWT